MKVSEWRKETALQKVHQQVLKFKNMLHRKHLIELFSHCNLCGLELVFHHKATQDGIEEHASCEHCQKESPKRTYRRH